MVSLGASAAQFACLLQAAAAAGVLPRRQIRAAGTICKAFEACFPSRATLPPYEWGRFRIPDHGEMAVGFQSIVRRLTRQSQAPGVAATPPVLLHIGPNALAQDEASVYRQLLSLPDSGDKPGQLPSLRPRLVFVEPLPWAMPKLRKWMRYATGSNSSGEIAQMAVCPSKGSTEDDAPILYTFSPKLLEDFPAVPKQMFGDLSTLSLQQLLDSIPRFQRDRNLPRMSEEEWLQSPYISQLPVHCPSPAELLKELDIDPSAVAMLTIDTEGFDTLLVPEFLDISGFSPAVLQFEYVNQRAHANATYEVVKRLASMGYDVVASFIDVIASQYLDRP